MNRKSAISVIVLLLILSSAAMAGEKEAIVLNTPNPQQPFPHHGFETKRVSKVSVLGQAYRVSDDLAVLEMFAFPEGETEIQRVTLKTADGKTYPGRIQKMPLNFMPQKRQNYQSQSIEVIIESELSDSEVS